MQPDTLFATPPPKHAPVQDAFTTAGLDATALARRVADGQTTPAVLLAQAHERCRLLNPAINAVVRDIDPPPASPQGANGIFAGVPFLLKDAFAWLQGHPTSNGSALLADAPKPRNSVLVERLLGAGVAIFGKTNCPEFNSLGTTEPRFFGPARNPWDLSRSTGGSSGGSAAAVAARIVPVAHASDGAGSIRIPASNCGLVGLKPTRGRITLAPVLGESINGCMSEGVVSLTVRDSAAFLDVMEGPAPGDPYSIQRPLRPYRQEVDSEPGRLRIAVTLQSLIGTEVDEACQQAVADASRLCARLGHVIVDAGPPIDGARYNQTYRRIWPVNVARSVLRLESRMDRDALLDQIEPFNRHLVEIAETLSAVNLAHAVEWMQSVGRDIAVWMDAQDIDLWLTPTLGTIPAALGHFDAGVHGGARVMDRFIQQVAFTTFANMSGQPAISLPLYSADGGLPVGVQFSARQGREDLLFRIAGQLERAHPWIDRMPALVQQAVVAGNTSSNSGTTP